MDFSPDDVWQRMMANEEAHRVLVVAAGQREAAIREAAAVEAAATAAHTLSVIDAGVEAVHGGDATHVEDPSRVIQQKVDAREITEGHAARLQALLRLFDSWRQEGLLAFEAPTGSRTCIMGWSKMVVNDPKAFNDKIKEMVVSDRSGGIWCHSLAQIRQQQLKNLTWGVYECLRKIGAKPRFRGPGGTDPGKYDMLYYKEWEFKDDESYRMKQARKRLAGVHEMEGERDAAGVLLSRYRLAGSSRNQHDGNGAAAAPTAVAASTITEAASTAVEPPRLASHANRPAKRSRPIGRTMQTYTASSGASSGAAGGAAGGAASVPGTDIV